MMTRSRLALLLATALLPMSPALAADYDPPVVYDQPDEYVPVEVGSGWYLRGDIGYVIENKVGTFNYRTFDAGAGTYGSESFDTGSLSKDFTFGAGIGYRYNDWLRADLTADGFRTRFDGTTSSDSPCVDPLFDPAYAGTGCRTDDGAEGYAVSVMANGYVDLGTYVGLTPYIGAGAGYTYVSWSDLDSSPVCVAGTGSCPGTELADVEHGGESDWRFSYAVMAGLAYDVNKNLKLDVGYKYRHIAAGNMFGFDEGSRDLGASGVQGEDTDLSQHEVKVGLRYELW